MTDPAEPSRAESGYTDFDQKKYLPGPPDAMLRHPVEPWRAGVWVGGGYSGATM